MLQKLKNLFRGEYNFLNTIWIFEKNLLQNLKYLQSLSLKLSIAPVLKSNAYGHGLVEIAKILDQQQVPFLCVDSLHEAYELLRAGVTTQILIMGYFDPKNLKIKKLPFSYSLFDLNTAKYINKYQPGARVHIKVDTGMHRAGVPLEELAEFCQKLKKFKNIQVEGLMSHLAQADNANEEGFLTQIKNFEKAQLILEKNGVKPKWLHLGASNALLHKQSQEKIEKVSNLIRAGKALYGFDPTNTHPKLQPVLKFSSTLAQIKTIKKGERVGYDWTYTSREDLLMGILPVGYNDGVDRRLSNQGFVKVKGIFCPIIGRVSMNITTIGLSQVPNPKVGDEVTLFSDNPKDKNSIENSAKLAGTIAHELLIHLISSTKRVVI